MNRRIVVGLLGLLVAGCTQMQSAMPKVGRQSPPPVGIEPMPPIGESINLGPRPAKAPASAAGLIAAREPSTPAEPVQIAPPIPVEPPKLPVSAQPTTPSAPGIATQPVEIPAPAEEKPPQPLPTATATPPVEEKSPQPLPTVTATPPVEKKPLQSLPVATETPPIELPPPVVEPPAEGLPPALPPPTPSEEPVASPPAANPMPAPPLSDPAIRPASATSTTPPSAIDTGTTVGSKIDFSSLKTADSVAAKVGNEVILLHEVIAGVNDRLRDAPPEQRRDVELRLQVGEVILNDLIDQSLVLQEAKGKYFKKPKQIDTFNEAADKEWREKELPPLMRQHHVDNEYELRRVYKKMGKSLDEVREAHRKTMLYREYLVHSVRSKLTPTYRDMLEHYNLHIKEFDRPAAVIWREVSVEFQKHPSPEAARRKAEMLWTRLAQGADFAKLAEAQSDGPTASKGGRWETTPGGFAEPVVNKAMEGLAPGQMSPILETNAGFHIVKVESRRAAGPARFDEVQDEVREKVFEQKKNVEIKAFIDKLRAKTPITLMIFNEKNDPTATKIQR